MITTAAIHLHERDPSNGQRPSAGHTVIRTGDDACVCITICDGRGAEVKVFVSDPEFLAALENAVTDATHDLYNARAVAMPRRS